jgi:hypothetical protein
VVARTRASSARTKSRSFFSADGRPRFVNEVFHPGLPGLRELLLQFLYLHLPGQFSGDVIQQLVVCQWPERINQHIAEDLEVDIAVQLFQQFREAQLRLHLQKHQGHLSFRREVTPPAAFRPEAFAHQATAGCQFMEREQSFDPTKFRLLERLAVQFVKIILRKRKIQ